MGDADKVMQQALKEDMNLRKLDDSTVTIALDETTKIADVDTLFSVLNGGSKPDFDATSLAEKVCALLHGVARYFICRQMFDVSLCDVYTMGPGPCLTIVVNKLSVLAICTSLCSSWLCTSTLQHVARRPYCVPGSSYFH